MVRNFVRHLNSVNHGCHRVPPPPYPGAVEGLGIRDIIIYEHLCTVDFLFCEGSLESEA